MARQASPSLCWGWGLVWLGKPRRPIDVQHAATRLVWLGYKRILGIRPTTDCFDSEMPEAARHRIIDIHTHPAFFDDDVDRREVAKLIRRARRIGIERMVVLGDVLRYGRLPSDQQIRRINDQTAMLVEWFPDYFVGFCYVNPKLGSRSVEREVARCVKHGFRGIKLEISCNAADRDMRPVMEQAGTFGIPVLQHTADQTQIRQRSYHSDPIDTGTLGRRFPEVQIIMAHLTAVGMRGVREVEDVPNIVVDTSAFQPVAGHVEHAVSRLGAERVVYGSDLVIRDLGSSVGRVVAAGLTRVQRDLVLFGNAARILGLDHDD